MTTVETLLAHTLQTWPTTDVTVRRFRCACDDWGGQLPIAEMVTAHCEHVAEKLDGRDIIERMADAGVLDINPRTGVVYTVDEAMQRLEDEARDAAVH